VPVKTVKNKVLTARRVPVRIIEKGMASDRVVIDAVVSKVADYIPLYRQSAILDVAFDPLRGLAQRLRVGLQKMGAPIDTAHDTIFPNVQPMWWSNW